MADEITVYSTTWCGHCHRLIRQLNEAGIAYRVVDVDDNPQFGDRIVAATGGYRTVPSIEVGGALLVNPSLAQVQTALGA